METKSPTLPSGAFVLANDQGPTTNDLNDQRPFGHSPVSHLYCAALSGTTDSRPCRTSGESANNFCCLISASVFGEAIAFPALIFTSGVFGSPSSTDTTDAVPTAVFSSPVW